MISLAERGARFLRELPPASNVTVAVDRDVDGLSSGVILVRALERLGHRPDLVVARRGEHVHADSMRARMTGDAIVVADMGSRSGAIVAGTPTLVIDHHRPSGEPDGAVLVNAHLCDPIPSSSWLTFDVVERAGVDVGDLRWLAVLGAYADLGPKAPLPGFAAALSDAGKTNVGKAVSLLNAARRAVTPIEDVAARVLLTASSATEIVRGSSDDLALLERARAEVAAETARCGRVAPKIIGDYALIRFSSGAQVHPLVATRWTGRLHDKIVIAANDAYLPGRVNFALRSSRDVDLLEVLREHAPPDCGTEFGHGHARATGGSVTPDVFDAFVERLAYRLA